MSRPLVHLVDDDEASGTTLQSSLEMQGFEARWTPAFTEGNLSKLRSNVVVLDLAMPGLDGFQTIDRIARYAGNAQLIIASGQSLRIINAAVGTARAAGLAVIGTLEKPYTARGLIALLEQRFAAFAAKDLAGPSLVQGWLADGSLLERVGVHFQPKMHLSGDEIAGYEALGRLIDNPSVSPEHVFDPTMPFDVRLDVTAKIIRESVLAARSVRDAGLTIAFNCPADILCSPDFIPCLEREVREGQVRPSDIVVELTEHPTADSLRCLARTASQLTMRGYGFAVDDFGRGMASFEVLTQLPFSELKIDKEIFWSTLHGDAAAPMLREVIAYCRSHEIRTTIEGIETSDQRFAAIEMGADLGQGYLWSRAAPLT